MTKLIWTFDDSVISEPLDMGTHEHLGTSSEYQVSITHDSDSEIQDCGFYIAPYSSSYTGTLTARKDYEQVLWLANNFEGYGLFVIQDYKVTGVIASHDGIRILDFDRTEKKDIFAGQYLEILNGNSAGEKALIASYDVGRQLFILSEDFSTDVDDMNYKISIHTETPVKTQQGSSYSYPIDLIHNGGIIDKFENISIKLKVKIPQFAKSAGRFLIDFNMQFTSLEE